MDFLRALNISGSGLTAQKARMDIISQNIANAQVTRTENGTPYRRKVAVLNSIEDQGDFRQSLDRLMKQKTGGVQIKAIVEDQSSFVPVYDPAHPDADEEGYVMMPNVNTTKEMIDLLGASRAYESNVTVFNAMKAMAIKALEIGR